MASAPTHLKFSADPDLYLEGRRAPDRFTNASPAQTIPAKAACALGVTYLLLLLVAHKVPAPDQAWASVGALLLFVFLPLGIVYHGVRIPLAPRMELQAGGVAVCVWLALLGLDRATDVALIAPARSVALVMAALFLGMFASRIIRDRNLLVPACIAAALADIVSVGWSFTAQALEHAPSLVNKLSVAVPTMAVAPAAAGEPAYPLVAVIGAGDIFFIALFFAAAARFGLPLRKTFCFVYPLVVLALAMTVFGIMPWTGIPGLPFICAGVLAANTRAFSMSRSEWRSLAVVGVVLLCVTGLAMGAMAIA